MEILEQLESDVDSWLCSDCGISVSIDYPICNFCERGTKETADELAESCDLCGKFPSFLGVGMACYLELESPSSFSLVFKNYYDGSLKARSTEDLDGDEEANQDTAVSEEEAVLHIVGKWERNDRYLSLLVTDLKEIGSSASRNGLPLRISDFVQQGRDAAPIVPEACEKLHCNVNTAPIYLWFYIQSPVQLLSRMIVHEAEVGVARDRSCDMLWRFGPKEC